LAISKAEAHLLFSFISACNEHKSLVVTSNKGSCTYHSTTVQALHTEAKGNALSKVVIDQLFFLGLFAAIKLACAT